jgi:peptidoglycan hydrolase-like protein with peptidoglycan-binding domain
VRTVEETRTPPAVAADAREVDGPRGGSRRRVWLAGAGVLVVLGAAVGVWGSARSEDPAPAATGVVATARVERGTLSATETWDGTIEYGTPFTVNSGAAGTVTRLLDQGESVGRGDELYRVDERPVTLLVGEVPMFRDLAIGDSGVDVRQLETNLAKLRYDGFEIDRAFTASTAEAVRAWQRRIGVEPTGSVARSDVIFAPAGGRVDAVHVRAGSVVSPGAPILDLTGDNRIVALEAGLDDRDRFDIGTKAAVVLADGDELKGTVRAVRVARVAPGAPAGESGQAPAGGTDAESVLDVELALAKAPEDLVGAPVEVNVAIDERADVLVVPVTALLALAEGGYGLEVVRGATSEIVRVDTGLFADGKVEASGAGIAEGTVVGVAGR